MQHAEIASTSAGPLTAPTQSYEENIQWLAAFLGSSDAAGPSQTVQDDSEHVSPEGTRTSDAVSEHDTPSLDIAGEQLEHDSATESTPAQGTPVASLDAIDDEMRNLLDMRDNVLDCVGANDALVKELREGIQVAQGAADEASGLEHLLRRADDFDAQDSAPAVVTVDSREVQLPLDPSIYEQIPLLASQAREVQHLQALATKIPWTIAEQQALLQSAMRECRRLKIHKLASEAGQSALALQASTEDIDDKELLDLSSTDHAGVPPFDWKTVSIEVGRTHTPEECRTRWLMKVRPGINKEEWDEAELSRLRDIVQPMIQDPPIRWAHVADELATGRLPVDCMRAAIKNGMLPERTPPLIKAQRAAALQPPEQAQTVSPSAIRHRDNAAQHVAANSTTGAAQGVDEDWLASDDAVLALAIKQLPKINGNMPWFAISKRVGKSVASCQHRLEKIEGSKLGAANAKTKTGPHGGQAATGGSTKRRKTAK